MEAFEDDGIFWLPGKENEQQAGRVKFDPLEGATLGLIGAFGGVQEQFNAQPPMLRILGVAGKRYLTLDGCFNSNTKLDMPGITRQTYHVGRIIAGHLFDKAEALTFDKCSVALDQLPHWVRRSGVQAVTLQTPTPDIAQSVEKLVIEFTPVQDDVEQVDDEELRLASTWTLGGNNITETYLNQGVHLELKYPAARSLEDILDDVKAMQDLLTLATTAPTVPAEIVLWRNDITRESKPDEYRPQAMTYYAGQLAERVRLDAAQSPGHVLFQFHDIGGLATIGRWIKIARKYHTVLGSLLSIRYASGMYVENRFNNVISAAESFHRLRFSNELKTADEFKQFCRDLIRAVPKDHRNWLGNQLQYSNEPRLRHRLDEMATYCGEAFKALYPDDISAWVKVVTESRNRLTHHDQERLIRFEPGDLYFLTESVFVLVMLCMFRECGVRDDVLATIRDNGTTQFLRGKLEEVVPRIHAQVIENR